MRLKFSLFLSASLLALSATPSPAPAQSAGGAAAEPSRTAPAASASVAAPPKAFQPMGAFPTNTITNRPFIGPQKDIEGLRTTVGALQRTLTELQQLQLQIKQIHWNVSGAGFWQIHEMLQQHYEGASKYADTIAERLLAIGASADGRATTVVRTSRVPEVPGGFVNGADGMAWFATVYKLVGDEVRQAILDTQEVDPTSSNLLQDVEAGIAKYQWQTRAFLQATPTNPNTGADFNAGRPVDLPSQTPPAMPSANNRSGGTGTNESGNATPR